MEPVSYQITIKYDDSERIVEEILISPDGDGNMPSDDDFKMMLENVRDSLVEQNVYGELTFYRLERTTVANIPAAKPKLELPDSKLILPADENDEVKFA